MMLQSVFTDYALISLAAGVLGGPGSRGALGGFGVPGSAGTPFIARLYRAAHTTIGVACGLSYGIAEWRARGALALFVDTSTGFVVTLPAQLAGLMDALDGSRSYCAWFWLQGIALRCSVGRVVGDGRGGTCA